MVIIDKLLIASQNPAKIAYYRRLFVGLVDSLIGLPDLGIEGKPEESGETAEENAEIKTRFYSKQTDLPTFCEDEALYADFMPLEKQPGIHVRRINGVDEVSDDELLAYWEKLIKNTPSEKRTGKWHIAYSLSSNGKTKTVSTDHKIMFFHPSSKIRIPGWPMSSLEGSIELKKPNSERTKEEIDDTIRTQSSVIIEVFKDLLMM